MRSARPVVPASPTSASPGPARPSRLERVAWAVGVSRHEPVIGPNALRPMPLNRSTTPLATARTRSRNARAPALSASQPSAGQLGEPGDALQEAIDGAVGRRPQPLQHGLQALAQPGEERGQHLQHGGRGLLQLGRRPGGRRPAPGPTPARRQRGSTTRTRPPASAPRPAPRRRRRRGRAARPPGHRRARAVRCTGGGRASRRGRAPSSGRPSTDRRTRTRRSRPATRSRPGGWALEHGRVTVLPAASSTRLRPTAANGSQERAARCTGGVSGSS